MRGVSPYIIEEASCIIEEAACIIEEAACIIEEASCIIEESPPVLLRPYITEDPTVLLRIPLCY